MNIIHTTLEWNEQLILRDVTDTIVIHHAAAVSCRIEDIHRWHLAKGWAGCGYHFLVRKDGSVYAGRPVGTVGAHAYGHNRTSIGICFEGNFTEEQPTEVQLLSGAELVRELLRQYSLKPSAVKRHSDLNATVCPGNLFPFNSWVAKLEDVDDRKAKVLRFQRALLDDGFSLPKYGADGIWGSETAKAASKCIIKWRRTYLNPHTTALAQTLLGVVSDGMCGPKTDAAIRAYQRAHRLTVDGCIGINTWKALILS